LSGTWPLFILVSFLISILLFHEIHQKKETVVNPDLDLIVPEPEKQGEILAGRID